MKPGDESPTPDPAKPGRRRGGLLVLAIAAALVAAAGWGLEARRGAVLAEQVAELETRVRAQQGEIAARQRHLESLRSVAAAVEQQVGELRLLVDRDPTASETVPTPADRQ